MQTRITALVSKLFAGSYSEPWDISTKRSFLKKLFFIRKCTLRRNSESQAGEHKIPSGSVLSVLAQQLSPVQHLVLNLHLKTTKPDAWVENQFHILLKLISPPPSNSDRAPSSAETPGQVSLHSATFSQRSDHPPTLSSNLFHPLPTSTRPARLGSAVRVGLLLGPLGSDPKRNPGGASRRGRGGRRQRASGTLAPKGQRLRRKGAQSTLEKPDRPLLSEVRPTSLAPPAPTPAGGRSLRGNSSSGNRKLEAAAARIGGETADGGVEVEVGGGRCKGGCGGGQRRRSGHPVPHRWGVAGAHRLDSQVPTALHWLPPICAVWYPLEKPVAE